MKGYAAASSSNERPTHAGVAIDVQLVAWPAGALEGSPSVDANVVTGPIWCRALIHIYGIRHVVNTAQHDVCVGAYLYAVYWEVGLIL